ncbi:MAG: acetyl-CoA C-acetyltransferase [Candidatus Dormibacteraeota bacterium]|nr:acetyl-CoA C-acetyltransferase [Candidatus Dormibacteraeota bacterium]
MEDYAVIVSAARTPVGVMGGALASVPAPRLGAVVVEEAIRRAGITGEDVDEVLMGNVLQAGVGENPARQAAVFGGVPTRVPAMTVNKLCGSGMKTIILASQAVRLGDADCVVAGGMESMSKAPYLVPNARFGYRLGDGELLDAMMRDGLHCALEHCHMGITAENVARDWEVSRSDQDAFALRSQQRTGAAMTAGRFHDEIVAVPVKGRKETVLVDADEGPRPAVTADQLAKLRPAFDKDGSVTAGNSSGVNDGASAVVVMSAARARELNLTPLARIRAYASAGVEPRVMGVGPIPATRAVLRKAHAELKDVQLIELNEAFAAQGVAVMRDLALDEEITNVNGGAIAMGHPIGSSGTRIVVTLIHEMIKRDLVLGLATMCIGGGQGIAMLVERN